MQCYPFIHSDDTSAPPAENLQLVCARDCPAEPVQWLWPEKIPLGKVTLLIGDPGLGKSLLALDIAARISTGKPWPDHKTATDDFAKGTDDQSQGDKEKGRQGETNSAPSRSLSPCLPVSPSSTIILSATDDLADTVRPRLDAAGADPRRIFFVPSITDLREDFNQLRVAVNCPPNCRLIIIDPINAYVGTGDAHFQTVVRKILAPLARLAADKNIAVLAIAHVRKTSGAAIYRAAGSMGYVAAARAAWTVSRDDDKPGRNLFLPLKNNLTPTASGLAYTIQSNPKNGCPTIVWDSSPMAAPAEGTPRTREATDLNEARQWLRKILAHGPRPASQIFDEATHLGFQQRTLRRALHAIGGATQNRGILDGWWWSVPDPAATQSAPGSAGGFPTPDVTSTTSLPDGAGRCRVQFPETFDRPADVNTDGTEKPVPSCPLPEIPNKLPSPTGRGLAGHHRGDGRAESAQQKVPVPLCEPPTASEAIAALNRLDRRRGRFPGLSAVEGSGLASIDAPGLSSVECNAPSPNNSRKTKRKPKRPPKSGDPMLDALFDSLCDLLPSEKQEPENPPPNSS